MNIFFNGTTWVSHFHEDFPSVHFTEILGLGYKEDDRFDAFLGKECFRQRAQPEQRFLGRSIFKEHQGSQKPSHQGWLNCKRKVRKRESNINEAEDICLEKPLAHGTDWKQKDRKHSWILRELDSQRGYKSLTVENLKQLLAPSFHKPPKKGIVLNFFFRCGQGR